MVRRIAVVVVAGLLSGLAMAAETSPYVDLQHRGIKALSESEIAGYLDGEGMGLALPAELNGYPGPRHVLDMAAELDLGAEQVAAVRASFDAMHAEAVRLGKELVELEGRLDALFRAPAVDAAELRTLLERIGAVRAGLRLAHLRAHVETRRMLSDEQVRRYAELRGYDAPAGSPGNHHHGHGHGHS